MCEVYLIYEEDPHGGPTTFGDAFFSRRSAEDYVRDQKSRKEMFWKYHNNKPPYEKEWYNPEIWRPSFWEPQIKEIQVLSE